jgi:ABC-2 type transport system permease protein
MGMDSLARVTWRSQARMVAAVVRKNWLHFIRYPLNAAFGVLEPLIWLTPLLFLGRSFATPEGNTGFAAYAGTADYMAFAVVGMTLQGYIGSMFWGMGLALKNEMDSGTLESNWLTPSSRFGLLLGTSLFHLLVRTVLNAGLLALAWMLFGFEIRGDVLLAAAIAAPMLVALYGFGCGFAALILLMRESNTLIDVSDFLVSVLSGGQFPVTVLPRVLLPISLALPLTYGFDAVRGVLLGARTLLPIGVEVAILAGFMAVTVPLGFALFTFVERRCRRLGTLGMH